jgi:hypothetical protein
MATSLLSPATTPALFVVYTRGGAEPDRRRVIVARLSASTLSVEHGRELDIIEVADNLDVPLRAAHLD